jgi:hypothetical protein
MKNFASRACISVVSAIVFIAGCSGGTGDSGAALNGGVGQVCKTGTECQAGLTCHTDSVDWIAHQQCASTCESDADCTTHFGAHTMCIGAHLCVSKCLDNADCPTGTQCSDNGWCEHTGPGSGVPKCAGSPTPCSLLSDTACSTTLGCLAEGQCSGVGGSCSSQFDSYSCEKLGCYWSSSSSSCSGFATPCSSNTSDFACTSQTGCTWTRSCSGAPIAKSCEKEPAALCKYTAGCSLVPQ